MDEEDLNAASKRRKIEDTVLQILKASDLETATEFSVRGAAEERLGLCLSGLSYRRLVQQLIESFLLSTAGAALGTPSPRRNNDCKNNIVENGDYNGKVICKLSDRKMVTIHDVNGTTMVAIRDFDLKDGNMRPSRGVNSGFSLTPTQWSSFRNSFPSIQEAIVKLESRLRRKNAVRPSSYLNHRPEAIAKQSEADLTNSAVDSAVEKNQTEADISNSTSIVHHPIKTEQVESEAETTADSVAEKTQTQAGIYNSDSQNHIIAKRNQEAALTSASLATSDSQEQIPTERNQTEADISNSAPPFPVRPHRLTLDERKQIEADISNSSQEPSHYTANAVRPEQLVPIQPARLDGRNYHSWRHQMEFLLNQLNIAYVLAEPCPSISWNPEASFDAKVKVKDAIQRWTNDDYMCRHNILNSLCDNLFQLYLPKNYSARELWEELKSACDEDFGTKRSQINKYIQFQMVDGVSVLEQAQELGKIADSIIASGIWVDENFHVGVIVSKLPPSWKEFRVRLMREDFLPLNMLMHRLQVEEESRKKETDHKKGRIEPKLDTRLGMRKKVNKRVCYSCGKDGHVSTNCADRKFEGREKSNEKENGAPSPRTGNTK